VPIFSRRFGLWTRLYSRMLLEPTSGDMVTPTVSEIVVPVIDADAILQTPGIEVGAGDLSPTAGSVDVPMLTVPVDEEWEILECITDVTTAVSRLSVFIGGTRLYLTAATVGPITQNMRGYIMRTGDRFEMLATGSGSDSDKNLWVTLLKSDLST